VKDGQFFVQENKLQLLRRLCTMEQLVLMEFSTQDLKFVPTICWQDNESAFHPLKTYVPPASKINNSPFSIYGFCITFTVNRDYFLKQH
jgi:hypothetical protein